MHNDKKKPLAHSQAELVSLLLMHNHKKERLVQCQAELVSLLLMHNHKKDGMEMSDGASESSAHA